MNAFDGQLSIVLLEFWTLKHMCIYFLGEGHNM